MNAFKRARQAQMWTNEEAIWEQKAEESQGESFFRSELATLPKMKLINQVGEITSLPPVKTLRGAKTFYHFLLRHKEKFEARMTLNNPPRTQKSNVHKVLRTLPMLGIGRHVWLVI